MLYRTFPWNPEASPRDEGGPLHVARHLQGGSRHDNPRRYGTIYLSRDPVGAVGEWLRRFVGRPLSASMLSPRPGVRVAIVALDDGTLPPIPNLDDPAELVARDLRPSRVATRDRKATRRQALDMYEEGVTGFAWWSAIESSWINVTLFEDRASDHLRPSKEPEPLTLAHPAVREAAGTLALTIAMEQPRRGPEPSRG